jgi:broad specificity phosphatase PhoE
MLLITYLRCFLLFYNNSDPSWRERATRYGALVTDPPLSALGHKQARETAKFLQKLITTPTTTTTKSSNIAVVSDGDDGGSTTAATNGIDAILVSPYLRTIQTAAPTSDIFNVPIYVENGLSESHATKNNYIPSSHERFIYFPQIDPTYIPLVHDIVPTPGHMCKVTGYECESFPIDYMKRMELLARQLECKYVGQSIVLFSHAASLALVAALCHCSLRDMKFAPCGVYCMERRISSCCSSSNTNEEDDCCHRHSFPWTLVQSGHTNEEHVSENSVTTYPWGFEDEHFNETETVVGQHKGGRSLDMNYFVRSIQEFDDSSEHKSEM